VARVYGPITSWRLRAPPADAAMLGTLLARAFGDPLPLRYRGSPRAIGLARALCFVCVGSIGLGLGCDVPVLVVGGILGGVVTSGFWSGLSKKVVDLEPRPRRERKSNAKRHSSQGRS
jgi:MFS family permease